MLSEAGTGAGHDAHAVYSPAVLTVLLLGLRSATHGNWASSAGLWSSGALGDLLEARFLYLPQLFGRCLYVRDTACVQDGTSAAQPSGGRTAAMAPAEAQFVDTLCEDLERFNDFFIGKEEVLECLVSFTG